MTTAKNTMDENDPIQQPERVATRPRVRFAETDSVLMISPRPFTPASSITVVQSSVQLPLPVQSVQSRSTWRERHCAGGLSACWIIIGIVFFLDVVFIWSHGGEIWWLSRDISGQNSASRSVVSRIGIQFELVPLSAPYAKKTISIILSYRKRETLSSPTQNRPRNSQLCSQQDQNIRCIKVADTLPYRFKAGGDGHSAAHHHRSTTKSAPKQFKSKHSTKSAIKDRAKGKVESLDRGSRKTPHQQVMSKIDRRNHVKQLRGNKLAQREKEESVFAGRDGAPRIVALVPLCEDVNVTGVIKGLNLSVDVKDAQSVDTGAGQRVEVSRFKQKIQYLTPHRALIDCLDACRTADFVLFLMSAKEEVDDTGEQLLKCIESQGVSTVLVGVHNLDAVQPAKKKPDVSKSLKSFITHFFATQEKVYDLSNRQDCSNVMRSLCTTMPRGIRWREDRSWMVVEDSLWRSSPSDGDEVVLTGFVRGRGLKADRLVQVGDWGDFKIEKIKAAPLQTKRKGLQAESMMVDVSQEGTTLEEPTEDQDDLAELAPEEMTMDGGIRASVAHSERKAVLLDDHHYFNEDDRDKLPVPKKLPRGTSKYQAAWYLGDLSDSGSDLEDFESDNDEVVDGPAALGPADGHFDENMAEPTEVGAPSEYPQSEAFHDPAPDEEAKQIEAYRKQRKDAAEDDLEFPDEIELHPHVLARERLGRYRGLKSIRSSDWDTEEDKPHEPTDWSRLLEVSDYKAAKNRVLKEASTGGVKPGTRVHIHLRIPSEQRALLKDMPPPKALFSLLRHEHKRTAVNTSITLSSYFDRPLKAKEELILQCGPRRLVINPLFSQTGNTPNNVHKFDRYLHPGRTAAASFIGPVIWGAVPCLYFKREQPSEPEDAIGDLAQAMVNNKGRSSSSNLALIATGTSMAPSTNRVIAKRIILTGHPYKIHRKMVTVRYMFFNPEDVQYFRALQLWTKRGRSGFIKEALGTHGYFKATFDGKVNPMDAVAVSLYKRVWPRNSVMWTPDPQSNGSAQDDDEEMLEDTLEGDELSDAALENEELMDDGLDSAEDGLEGDPFLPSGDGVTIEVTSSRSWHHYS